jgi:hypothetical protein
MKNGENKKATGTSWLAELNSLGSQVEQPAPGVTTNFNATLGCSTKGQRLPFCVFKVWPI